MIINQQLLLKAAPIRDMLPEKVRYMGYSHGLTECGYDIRLAEDVTMFFGRRFVLAHAMEEFHVPNFLMGRVLNKSSWARQGIDASMTTNIEPGWKGFLTLELRYSKLLPIHLPKGVGIAQVIFEPVAVHVDYVGRYQNQPNRPVAATLINDSHTGYGYAR